MEPFFPGGKKVFIINSSWFTSWASLAVLLIALTRSTAVFALLPGEVEAFKVKKYSNKEVQIKGVHRTFVSLLFS